MKLVVKDVGVMLRDAVNCVKRCLQSSNGEKTFFGGIIA